MSLRGVGKALYRTPYQMFGQKSSDDVIFRQWEHDTKTAIAGLEYLKTENIKWKKFWEKTVTKFLLIIEVFRDLHCQLEDAQKDTKKKMGIASKPKVSDKNEQFASTTLHELEEAAKLAKLIYERVADMSLEASASFVSKCDDMIKVLKNVEKLMVKRDHKKVDYDISHKKLEASLKHTDSEKGKIKVETNQKKLTDIEIIFKDLNYKVKLIVPQRNIEKFNRIHGIVNQSSLLTYEEIVNDFNILHFQAQSKLQELELLKDFSSLREKNFSTKTVEHVNSAAGTVIDSTVNFTSTVYTKATKPSQNLNVSTKSFKIDNPVKTYSKNGMFESALDPIEFIQQTELENGLHDIDLGSIQMNSPSDFANEDSSVASNDNGIVSPNSSLSDSNNWMKPLKNSTLNVNKVRPNTEVQSPISPVSDVHSDLASSKSNKTTLNTSLEYGHIANSRVASVHIDEKTKTYKYANVTIDNIAKQIYLAISTPEIDDVPLTTPRGQIHTPDKLIMQLVTAKSSITANAFATYSN
ncbi:hypothetical protein JL09_g3439 [Pichia kudriavzevii]|uniref:Uncharacterized protein n=1 Tax=Pichia kudriavzevii TaxID=4909 RepID=A0A099NZU2_PICKU|nr:hypothetical protein JL09_g3439 [Pichia kudriavzevii]